MRARAHTVCGGGLAPCEVVTELTGSPINERVVLFVEDHIARENVPFCVYILNKRI